MVSRRDLRLRWALAVAAAASQIATVRGQSGPRLYTTWSQPGGSIEGAQYSALRQINKSNVHQLELQWFHPAPGPAGRFAFSPLVVDNVMYVVGKDSAVFALDAATGKEIWTFATEGTPTNRGFNYWESKDRSDRRIIFASRSYLQQLDARTGKPIASFGVNGLVNLREGLGRTPLPTGGAQSGSPGQVFENLLVLGSAPGRRVQLAARRHPRVRCADRQARLDVPHDSSSRRVRLRHVAARCVEDRGRREHLGRVRDRREARHRVLPARLADLRSLGRRSQREQPVRQHAARARPAHRQAPLALPAAASRSVGLRSRHRAEAADREARTASRSTSSRRPRSSDCCMCSIASPASRSGRSRSGPCRRATCPASSRRRRSRFPRNRRRSRG